MHPPPTLQGERLSINYRWQHTPTADRRAWLAEGYLFDCCCALCSGPGVPQARSSTAVAYRLWPFCFFGGVVPWINFLRLIPLVSKHTAVHWSPRGHRTGTCHCSLGPGRQTDVARAFVCPACGEGPAYAAAGGSAAAQCLGVMAAAFGMGGSSAAQCMWCGTAVCTVCARGGKPPGAGVTSLPPNLPCACARVCECVRACVGMDAYLAAGVAWVITPCAVIL